MITRSMQLRRRRILAKPRSMVGVLLFVSVCAGAGCDKQGQSAPSLPPPPEVLVAAVMQRDVPIYSEWLGTTDGAINAQIRARVQGYLQQRLYREGTFVKAGDLLFSIDPRPYQAALDQAKGDLGRAEAALGKTQLDVSRYTPLAKEGAISQQERTDRLLRVIEDRPAEHQFAARNIARQPIEMCWPGGLPARRRFGVSAVIQCDQELRHCVLLYAAASGIWPGNPNSRASSV